MRRNIRPNTATVYSAGLNTRLEQAFLGFRVDVDHGNDIRGLLTLSTSIGYDPVKRSPWMSGARRAQSGQFVGRVFVDENDNGIFDEGEPLVPNARLVTAGQRRSAPTDETGRVLMAGLDGYRPTDIAVDRASLEDPFWVPRPEGIRVVPRPGTTGGHDFAIVTTGEVDGTVFRVIDGAAQPISGAIVQLLDERERVMRTERSAYDGFYLFDFVLPGRYRVRVDPAQLRELALQSTEDRELEITGSGSIAGDQNLILVPRRN